MTSRLRGTRSIADDDRALGPAVVETVSTASGTPVADLPPLRDAVESDALEALFSRGSATGYVRFVYAGHVVTVHADRTIEVSPSE